jgi:serine/threonine protein phosphatase PrpC
MAENLIRAANNNGGTDNITVVLVQAFAETMWPAAHGYHQGYAQY